MDPDPDFESKDQPDELPPSAKLQAGYVRYVRIKPEEGPDGEICLETCIRRSQPHRDHHKQAYTKRFHYIAVSYAWGDATLRHPVIVDGDKCLVATNLWHFLQRTNMQRTDFQVMMEVRAGGLASVKASLLSRGRSLEEFHHNFDRLEALRRPGWSGDWLWIDALCIDQSDDRERMHQVGIMSEIFGRADFVVSWLGPAYDNSEHAMRAIAGYADGFGIKRPTISPMELPEAICSLCERPYWKRLWVFQELRHANHIVLMCGEHSLSWDAFRNLWRVILDVATTREDASERLRQSLATRMITLRTKPMDFSLWNLLKETRNLECVDRRDRVYALLSVATEGHEGIKADYDAYTNSTAMDLLYATESGIGSARRRQVRWCLGLASPDDFDAYMKRTTLEYLGGTELITNPARRRQVQWRLGLASPDDFGSEADWHAFLVTSALAHRVLRVRYATRPPATLDDVRLDCEFLVGVFGFEDPQMGVSGDRVRPPQSEEDFYCWAQVNGHQAVVSLLDMLD